MKKLFSLLLKSLAILGGLTGVGMGVFLFFMLSDKDSNYMETPYYIGMIGLIAAFVISAWYLSKNMTVSNLFVVGSFLSIVTSGYYALMPIGSASNAFMMYINTGNLFTFYSDDSYGMLEQSELLNKFQAMYKERLILVICLLALALVLFLISLYLKKRTAEK